jgi:hypothetical protein
VVDAASGKPVGGALVVSVEESEFTYHENDQVNVDGRGSGQYWLRKLGRAYATSADGRVVVPAPTAPRSLFIWSGANFGRTTLEVHDRAEHVVALAPRSLRVEVVDRAGQPQAGVPIQLATCSLYPMSFGTTVGVTGADGRIDIPALELERGAHRSCGRRDRVMLGAPIAGGEMRAADARVLEPVKFVLPECGSVEVELQDAQGRPLRKDSAPAHVLALALSISSFGPSTSAGAEPGAQRHMRSLRVPFVDGHCHLDRVELGADLQFQLRVLWRDSSYGDENLHAVGASEPDWSHVRGPVKAGEVRHVVLRAGFFGARVEDSDPDSKMDEPAEIPDDLSGAAAHEPSAVLCPRSSVAISVRLDVPIEPCWLRVRLDGNRDPNENDSNPWIDVNGRATLRNVPAGTHSIEITRSNLSSSYWEEEVVLHESGQFEVAPAEHLRDPRLMDIDLRGRLRPRHLEIVDRDGSPLSGFVFQTGAERPKYDKRMGFERGRADFLAIVGDGLSTYIAANRFRPQVLAPDSTVRRAVLERGIPIRLTLAPGFELPDASRLEARLYVGVSELPHFVNIRDELRALELVPGADLRFELAEPGKWPVVFLVGRKAEFDREQRSESNLINETITVLDRADEQTFVITPDRDRWNRLVGSLRASK